MAPSLPGPSLSRRPPGGRPRRQSPSPVPAQLGLCSRPVLFSELASPGCVHSEAPETQRHPWFSGCDVSRSNNFEPILSEACKSEDSLPG